MQKVAPAFVINADVFRFVVFIVGRLVAAPRDATPVGGEIVTHQHEQIVNAGEIERHDRATLQQFAGRLIERPAVLELGHHHRHRSLGVDRGLEDFQVGPEQIELPVAGDTAQHVEVGVELLDVVAGRVVVRECLLAFLEHVQPCGGLLGLDRRIKLIFASGLVLRARGQFFLYRLKLFVLCHLTLTGFDPVLTRAGFVN